MVVVGIAIASAMDNENETAVVLPDCVGMSISLAVGVILILIVGEGVASLRKSRLGMSHPGSTFHTASLYHSYWSITQWLHMSVAWPSHEAMSG